MRTSGVPVEFWGQNLIVFGLGVAGYLMLVCWGKYQIALPPTQLGMATLLATTLVLASTLLFPGQNGVRRWVLLGPIRIHVASIVLPLQLIVVNFDWRRRYRWAAPLVTLVVAGLLTAQPDAAQTTAFTVAVSVTALSHPSSWAGRVQCMTLIFLVAVAWARRDSLHPVRHVEGIVVLAYGVSTLCGVIAVAAVTLLPLPFLAAWWEFRARGWSNDREIALALFAYFTTAALASATSRFPVPMLGYGAAPIIGYFAGIGWLAAKSGDELTSRKELLF
jgi:hypothetical protein